MCWYSFREKTPFVFIQSLSWDPGEQTEHSSSHTGGNLQLMQIFITQLTSAERCWFIGDEVFCTVVVFSLFIQNPAVLNIGQSSEIRFPDIYPCPQWSSPGFTLAQTRINIHFNICKIPRGISIVFVFLLLWATWKQVESRADLMVCLRKAVLGRHRTRARDDLLGELLSSNWLEFCWAGVTVKWKKGWHDVEHP